MKNTDVSADVPECCSFGTYKENRHFDHMIRAQTGTPSELGSPVDGMLGPPMPRDQIDLTIAVSLTPVWRTTGCFKETCKTCSDMHSYCHLSSQHVFCLCLQPFSRRWSWTLTYISRQGSIPPAVHYLPESSEPRLDRLIYPTAGPTCQVILLLLYLFETNHLYERVEHTHVLQHTQTLTWFWHPLSNHRLVPSCC